MYHYDNKIKKSVNGQTVYHIQEGREEKYIQSFEQRSRRKETTWKG